MVTSMRFEVNLSVAVVAMVNNRTEVRNGTEVTVSHSCSYLLHYITLSLFFCAEEKNFNGNFFCFCNNSVYYLSLPGDVVA